MRGVVAESGQVSKIAKLLQPTCFSQPGSAVRGLHRIVLLETAHRCIGLIGELVEDFEE